MVRISHSGKEMYNQCGEKYRLHYIEKLRSPLLSSPLFAGGAFDDAASCMLLKLMKEPVGDDLALSLRNPYEVLVESFTTTKRNGETYYLPTYQYCKYSMKDFDVELLEADDLKVINEFADKNDFGEFDKDLCQEFVETCRLQVKNRQYPDKPTQELFNLINWHSFKNKLLYLLARYEEDVIPLIQEVISVQRKVELEAGEHTLIGYIDFEAIWKDEPDKVYTCDNKLSAKSYKDDSIEDAEQLATYCEFTGNDNGCFVNTEKVLRKREPRHRIQIVKGTITEELYEKTFDNFGEVVHNIEQGIFEKNLEGGCFFFGQRCQYYNTCRGAPEKDFLVDLKKKESK